MATSVLTEEQKLLLLAKAFPSGRHHAWFEIELSPLIKDHATWADVRAKIIERFSDTEDRDRHFHRLRELKFKPEVGHRLLDFVEDMLYSYRKAFPNESSQESRVRYVKAAIPQSLKSSLNMNPEFRDAKDEETLKRTARHFDMSNGGLGNPKPDNRPGTPELASILKDLVNGIRKEGEATRAAIVAAFKPYNEERNRYQRQSDSQPTRPNSPRRSDHRETYGPPRGRSPDFRRPRSPSPNTYGRRDLPPARKPDCVPSTSNMREDRQNGRITNEEAFSSGAYYQRFGKPPSPCSLCQQWHWSRHCLDHLKE